MINVLAQGIEPLSGLSQYGILGTLLLIALVAIGVLFRREVAAHERAIEREKAALERADRAEAELRELNRQVRERLEQAVEQLTDARAQVRKR